jgi:glucokinase
VDLVADIGATHARFQYSSDGVLLDKPVSLATRDFTQDTALLEAAQQALGGAACEQALLAVAGPLSHADFIEVTNTGLVVSIAGSEQVLGCRTRLANDFFALAHGVPYFHTLEQIGGCVADAAEPIQIKALLGPGSGLGMATLVPQVGPYAWQVIPSEGGHADLAPGSYLEIELWGVLMEQHQHVCWETVLCGPGLENLYRAMCIVWGMQPTDLCAADISAQGVEMTDPVCHQTLETFCALLGAAAGNLAVTVCATGGVYLGGGILPKIMDFVRASPLRRRFEERGAMSPMVRDIPVFVITQDTPGLVGAGYCLEYQKSLEYQQSPAL